MMQMYPWSGGDHGHEIEEGQAEPVNSRDDLTWQVEVGQL
jgi:hypothetical protein